MRHWGLISSDSETFSKRQFPDTRLCIFSIQNILKQSTHLKEKLHTFHLSLKPRKCTGSLEKCLLALEIREKAKQLPCISLYNAWIRNFSLRNGEDWFRLRTNVNQMMMRPQAVTDFLPQVNEVADDFIESIKSRRSETSGTVERFNNEISKWTLESKIESVYFIFNLFACCVSMSQHVHVPPHSQLLVWLVLSDDLAALKQIKILFNRKW